MDGLECGGAYSLRSVEFGNQCLHSLAGAEDEFGRAGCAP